MQHQRNSANQSKLSFFVPNNSNKYGQRTLKYVVPKLLNTLPQNILSINSRLLFKIRLKEWLLENIQDFVE